MRVLVLRPRIVVYPRQMSGDRPRLLAIWITSNSACDRRGTRVYHTTGVNCIRAEWQHAQATESDPISLDTELA